MTPMLGIMASSFRSAAGPEGAYDSLATVTLSANTTSIEFAGIPSGYKHLQLRVFAKTNSANFYDTILVRFNSDTASNYSSHYLDGYNSTVSAAGAASTAFIQTYYIAGNAANTFGVAVIDILDYSNTNKYKTTRSLAGVDVNTSGGAINFSSGAWRSTAAINSMTVYNTNPFTQYSSFALYGVK